MKVFEPKIEVRLIKTARRGAMTDGMPTNDRYKQISAIDLTSYLAENAMVSTQQYVSGGAGTWSLTLVDRMVGSIDGLVVNESLYALIEPQDMIEIRMAHSAHEYQGGSDRNKYKLPIVMRGFVSDIRRERSISEGYVDRHISLSGHDYTKLLETLRIYYLNNSAIGDNIIGGLAFFQKYAGLNAAKIMSVADFVDLVLDVLINPFIAQLTYDADGSKVGAAVVNQLFAEVSVKALVSPYSVETFYEGSVLDFLSQVCDVGAFNEMYLDDREEEVALVLRENPFLDLNNKLIQSAALPAGEGNALPVPYINVSEEDVESISEARSDRAVANYFWTTNEGWQIISNQTQKELAAAGAVKDYALFEYVNTNPARYGFRRMEVGVRTGPIGMLYPDEGEKSVMATETEALTAWLVDRRRVLALQNRDNAVLEQGTILLRGNEMIKRGMYMRIQMGGVVTVYYVTAVHHQFVPFQSFKTQVTYERSTGFVERARRGAGNYLSEMNIKGSL